MPITRSTEKKRRSQAGNRTSESEATRSGDVITRTTTMEQTPETDTSRGIGTRFVTHTGTASQSASIVESTQTVEQSVPHPQPTIVAPHSPIDEHRNKVPAPPSISSRSSSTRSNRSQNALKIARIREEQLLKELEIIDKIARTKEEQLLKEAETIAEQFRNQQEAANEHLRIERELAAARIAAIEAEEDADEDDADTVISEDNSSQQVDNWMRHTGAQLGAIANNAQSARASNHARPGEQQSKLAALPAAENNASHHCTAIVNRQQQSCETSPLTEAPPTSRNPLQRKAHPPLRHCQHQQAESAVVIPPVTHPPVQQEVVASTNTYINDISTAVAMAVKATLLHTQSKSHSCQPKKCEIDGCGYVHHRMLHSKKEIEIDNKERVSTTWTSRHTRAYLKIAPVRVSGPAGAVNTWALLDDGSTVTLMDDSIAAQIGAEGRVDPLDIEAIAGTKIVSSTSRRVAFSLQGQTKRHRIHANTVRGLNLSPQVVRDEDLESCDHLLDLRAHLIKDAGGPKLLIGQDYSHLLLAEETRTGPPHLPVASRTELGWVLHGAHKPAPSQRVNFVHHVETDERSRHHFAKEILSTHSTTPRGHTNQRAQRSNSDDSQSSIVAKPKKRLNKKHKRQRAKIEKGYAEPAPAEMTPGKNALLHAVVRNANRHTLGDTVKSNDEYFPVSQHRREPHCRRLTGRAKQRGRRRQQPKQREDIVASQKATKSGATQSRTRAKNLQHRRSHRRTSTEVVGLHRSWWTSQRDRSSFTKYSCNVETLQGGRMFGTTEEKRTHNGNLDNI